MSGATVLLFDAVSRQVCETLSDSDGHFEFTDVPAGPYRVDVRADGFLPFSVAAEADRELAIEMQLAPVHQTVQVEESLAPLAGGATVESLRAEQLASLPSNGRNVNRFAMLDPHIRNTQGLGSDGAAAARLTINAASFRTTYYMLDGDSNYDFSHGNAPQQKISVSGVSELQVLSNPFSAEYGRSAAGVIASTTKSGGDEFHGEAFLLVRPSGMQAAPVASSLRVPNELRQFGAAVGGPLGQRANFFTSYEQVRVNRGAFIQSPAPLLYMGHFHDQFGLARLDYRLSGTHAMSLRLNGNRDANDNPGDRVGGYVQPGAAQVSSSQAAGAQWADRVAFTPAATNEFHAAYVNALPSATRPVSPSVSVVRPSYSTNGGSSYSWYRTESFTISDVFAGRAGTHEFKFGGDWVRQKVRDFSSTGLGEYRFAPGPPLPGEMPIQYTQTFGTGFVRQGQTLYSAFFQDNWKLNPRVSLNYGGRYEYQSLTRDRNNFAPRAGLVLDATGRGTTILRAAAGVFYDQYYMYISRRFFLQAADAPTATLTLLPGNPAFPTFPESLPALPAGTGADVRDLYLRPAQTLNPYNLRYSASLEQHVGNWLFALEGTHSLTLKQMRARDLNAPAPFVRTGPGQKRSVATADATRPYTQYAGVAARNITLVENTGSSLYDALELSASRRFGKRYQVSSRYLYSSAMTYGMFFGEPNTGIPSDWGNSDRTERGPSDFHQRHRWVTYGSATAPGGVEMTFVFTAASGLPVNPLTGVDNNGDTNLVDRPWALGRNSFRAPANASLDFSAARRIHVKESIVLELRAEVFNALNHGNVVKVNATYGDGLQPLASFLQPVAGISNSDPARQFQFGLKLSF